MKTLSIKSTPPQAKFHALSNKYPAFVGGFGSGKSEAMCNQAIIDASHSPHALISLYAPTYDLVRLIIAPRLIEKLQHYEIGYEYNKSENVIKTKSGQFGTFILRSLDNPSRIVGYQAYRAHIDELDTLRLSQAKEAWKNIIARTRQIPLGVKNPFNRVCAYTTPEGFNFVHHRWIRYGNPEFGMVQASSRSNPYLPKDYVDTLYASYPPELRSAYIEGEFVNLTAGSVYKAYNRAAHDSKETIKEGEPLFIGCDFNVTRQAATVYVKRNVEGKLQWHAVAELTSMYDTPEMIRIIKERWQAMGHHITIYPDATGKSRKSVDANSSDIALLKQAGFEVKTKASNPYVRDRVNAMNAAITSGLIFVNARECPTVSQCLEQQCYDKNGEPDKQSGNDHQNDASTYPIAYELPIRKPITSINVSF